MSTWQGLKNSVWAQRLVGRDGEVGSLGISTAAGVRTGHEAEHRRGVAAGPVAGWTIEVGLCSRACWFLVGTRGPWKNRGDPEHDPKRADSGAKAFYR